MQFSRQHRRPDNDERILPLTNIVFLLLIFFMLAGQLSNPDAFAIRPPQSSSETPATRHGLLVQINADGAIAVDGSPVTDANLVPFVQDYLGEYPDAPIRLKADGLTDAARVVVTMTRLREAGVKRLRLLTMSTNR